MAEEYKPACDIDDEDYEMILECDALEAAQEAGGLIHVDSVDYEWLAEAERELRSYLSKLDVDADDMVPEPVGDEPESESPGADFAAEDRTASFGAAWEEEDLSNWAPEKVLNRKRYQGETYYLIKWKNHDKPTWELEEELEEEGHVYLLQEFNRNRQKGAEPKSRPERKKTVKPTFTPTDLWGNAAERIQKDFQEQTGFEVVNIYNVCDGVRAQDFAKELGNGTPVMVYHGTQEAFIPRIIREGLRVPGKGANPIRVANGSAYGVGIYTARSPATSIGYTRGSRYMFVCAGIVGDRFTTLVKSPGAFIIFFHEKLVLPCFVVEFQAKGATPLPPVPPILNEPPPIEECSARPVVVNPTYLFASKEKPARRAVIRGAVTKKQLKALPRSAKEEYKKGTLMQKKGAK